MYSAQNLTRRPAKGSAHFPACSLYAFGARHFVAQPCALKEMTRCHVYTVADDVKVGVWETLIAEGQYREKVDGHFKF